MLRAASLLEMSTTTSTLLFQAPTTFNRSRPQIPKPAGRSALGPNRYVDLGNRSLVSIPAGSAANLATTLTENFQNRYNIVRVGLNYKFNWASPVVAKY